MSLTKIGANSYNVKLIDFDSLFKQPRILILPEGTEHCFNIEGFSDA